MGPNELAGRGRGSVGLRVEGAKGEDTFNSAGSGGGAAAADARGTSTAKTGSGAEIGGAKPSGVVTSGGNGCAQLRLIFFGGAPAPGGDAVGRGTMVRGRTGGGGCEPDGTPSASRKRLTLSSSLSGGARRIGSLGAGGLGFCASPDPWFVSHLKIIARPARTRNMTVSFTEDVESR